MSNSVVLFYYISLLVIKVQSAQIISPTSSTTSEEIFDTTATNEFASATIICTKSKCNVICDTLNGCKGLSINATESDTLTLTCSSTSSCEDLVISSAAQISTSIDCTGLDSCEHSIFNVNNSASVDINCNSTASTIHNGACSYTDLNGQESTDLSIRCYGEWSCYKMDIYCPLSTNGQCDIECQSLDEINSCPYMNIFTPNANNIDMNCGKSHWETCYQTNIYCGTTTSAPKSMLQHISDDIGWGCTNDINDECCPFYAGTLDCNGQPTSCIIDCTSMNCNNYVIDGSAVLSSLTVNCATSNGVGGCGGAIIQCPGCGGGTILCSESRNSTICSVNCSDRESCNAATIRGVDAHRLTVTCSDSFSCQEMNVYATMVDDLTIYSEGLLSLNGAFIDARIANTVTLICKSLSGYSCGYMTVYAHYANSITLNASYDKAFYHSRLYAKNAGFVSISCSSKMGDYACGGSRFYIANYGNNTYINCYGDGCKELDGIYVNKSVSFLDLNVNACGQCNSLSNCTQPFTMKCKPLSVDSYSDSISLTNCSASSSNCGCNTFVNHISFQDDPTDSNCPINQPIYNDQPNDDNSNSMGISGLFQDTKLFIIIIVVVIIVFIIVFSICIKLTTGKKKINGNNKVNDKMQDQITQQVQLVHTPNMQNSQFVVATPSTTTDQKSTAYN